MPVRPWMHDLTYLLPLSLDELVGSDHPVRFVAEVVDQVGPGLLAQWGVTESGKVEGRPSYHVLMLLSVWLYGFMTGVRSTRKLEAACREQIPYLWLTGNQRPDHNTLWRFYQARRDSMRALFKTTVRVAVEAGLVDLALQAVDGTKIAGNASKERTYDRAGLERLAERTAAAIADLEAQNRTGGEEGPPRMPPGLHDMERQQETVKAALQRLAAEDDLKQVNLTDGDARLMQGRGAFVAGYNAQAMAAALLLAPTEVTGRLLTAEAVTTDVDDHAQLLPMLDAAIENTGQPVPAVATDGGYHSGEVLVACHERGQVVVMPESSTKKGQPAHPYHQDAFRYDPTTDCFTCPQGHVLWFASLKKRPKGVTRVYHGSPTVCRACPAFGICTTDQRHGRMVQVSPTYDALKEHRIWMATPEAQALARRRKVLPEPVFGILKEQRGLRRFLLRGLRAVQAEWSLMLTGFNLRTLWKVWRFYQATRKPSFVGFFA
jgi:transposase